MAAARICSLVTASPGGDVEAVECVSSLLLQTADGLPVDVLLVTEVEPDSLEAAVAALPGAAGRVRVMRVEPGLVQLATALGHVTAPVVVLVPVDARPAPGCLALLDGHLRTHPGVGAATGAGCLAVWSSLARRGTTGGGQGLRDWLRQRGYRTEEVAGASGVDVVRRIVDRPPYRAPGTPGVSRMRVAVRRARDTGPRWLSTTSRRARRQWFLLRLRLAGVPTRARVVADIHPDADIARRVRLELRRRSVIHLNIGSGARLQDGVILRLDTCTLDIGAGADLRYGVLLNVKGHLRLGGRVTLGRLTTVHCDGHQEWGFGAVAGEGTSVIDSDHVLDGTPVAVLDLPVRQRDIRIGAGAFLGAGSIVLAGGELGEASVLAAGSVLTGVVPDGHLAAGSPAQVRRALA